MKYLDYELEIRPGKGRNYPIVVIRSPAGEARETMRFPFDDLVLENRLQALQIALLRSGGKRRRVLSPEEKTVQEFGKDLFKSLITGEVRSRYDVSLSKATQQGKGLRLKLRIQSPELAALPWEFLYDECQSEYLCLSRNTPVVRYLELPQPIQALTVTPPLSILGMIASPSDLPPLDVERESQRVEKALKNLRSKGIVHLTWLPKQTWRELLRAMRRGPWHVFHFIGHGGFDPETDEGLISLADEEGRKHLLNATQLGRLLADHNPLRLVLLNACEGARGGELDIFSSSAAILVRRGIPAVLAMQYEITDRAAIEFARAFYESIADGLPIDASVAEARKAVSIEVTNTLEWGTPVLYMRSPDGILFELEKKPIVEPEPPKEPIPEKQEFPPPPPPDVTDADEVYTKGMEHYDKGDYESAMKFFLQAAEAGNAMAMNNLGIMYQYGTGVEQNDKEAVRWYRKAAEAGHADAMNNLGFMYEFGTGVKKNYKEAVRWYRKAAEAGHAYAMFNLGVCYRYGTGVEQNDKEAVRWYRKAAEAGDATAMNNLGLMFRKGLGVEQNYKESVRWYRKAAKEGYAKAMLNLGFMYEKGLGVDPNDKEAVRWYRKGAEAGHATAMYNLGRMYEKGFGVEKNYDEAVWWYHKASGQGYQYAIEKLKELGEQP